MKTLSTATRGREAGRIAAGVGIKPNRSRVVGDDFGNLERRSRRQEETETGPSSARDGQGEHYGEVAGLLSSLVKNKKRRESGGKKEREGEGATKKGKKLGRKRKWTGTLSKIRELEGERSDSGVARGGPPQ